jgi:hypothetical protein
LTFYLWPTDLIVPVLACQIPKLASLGLPIRVTGMPRRMDDRTIAIGVSGTPSQRTCSHSCHHSVVRIRTAHAWNSGCLQGIGRDNTHRASTIRVQRSKRPDWPEIGWPSEENSCNMLTESRIQGRQWKLVRREWLRALLFGSHLEEFFKTLDRSRYREASAD